MGRSKVKLAFIEDGKARKLSFKKRINGLLKKMSELSILCDVQACSIVYGPYSETPEVWPSQEGAKEVLTGFKNMSKYQQIAHEENQESITNEMIKKQEKEMRKLQMQNRRNDMTRVMYQKMRGEEIRKLSIDDLKEIATIADEKMKEIAARLDKINREKNQITKQETDNGMYCIEEGGQGQRVDMRNSVNKGNFAPGVKW